MAEPYDTYLLRIPAKEDRVLFEEAVVCAEAGAFRGSFVLTWLSAAESLKRRFAGLAPQDHAAGQIVHEFEVKEANHQAIDTFLLEKARHYGLISDSENTRLHHVYVMRCLLAHPYEEKPTIESLHSAMAEVVDLVLSRPIKLRHGYINSQAVLLMESAAYLDDLPEAVRRYAEEVYPKIADDLHVYFIEKLLSRMEQIAADASMDLFFRRGVQCLRAYLAIEPMTLLSAWDPVGALTRYPRSASMVLAQEEFWPLLSAHARELVLGVILGAGESAGEYLRALQKLHDAGVMTQREAVRFVKALVGMAPSYLAAAGISLRYFAATIIEELKSHDWYVQNPAIQVLRSVGVKGIADVDEEVQRKLGNNVLQAADGGARDAIALLDAIAAMSGWPEAFIAGITEECFINDANEVRFKNRELRRALDCLRSVDKRTANRILRNLARRLHRGTPSPWRIRERSKVIAVLQETAGADASVIASVTEAISKLEAQEYDFD